MIQGIGDKINELGGAANTKSNNIWVFSNFTSFLIDSSFHGWLRAL
jgi:hypothetical protein